MALLWTSSMGGRTLALPGDGFRMCVSCGTCSEKDVRLAKICGLAHAFLWECSYKRLKLA
jgi:hypothetical protein